METTNHNTRANLPELDRLFGDLLVTGRVRTTSAPRRRTTTTGAPRPRDAQKSKCYKAEQAGAIANHADNLRFTDARDAGRFINDLVATDWFQARWALRPVTVRAGNGRTAWARASQNKISLPTWALTRITVLHELAHLAAAKEAGGANNIAAHGPEFITIVLTLVEHTCGFDFAADLAKSYRAHRVRYNWTPNPVAVRATTPVVAVAAKVSAPKVKVSAPKSPRTSTSSIRHADLVTSVLSGGGWMLAPDVAIIAGGPTENALRHTLRAMVDAGLLHTRKVGRSTAYRLAVV